MECGLALDVGVLENMFVVELKFVEIPAVEEKLVPSSGR